MILIPALHLVDGKVVRLDGGDADSAVVIAENPLEIARGFARQGALFFQLTDLDAVFGRGDNLDVVRAFADAMLPCQYGGGVRTAERVEQVVAAGADRVLIGTLFQSDPATARDLVARFGVRILAALDAEDGEVRTNGWADGGSSVDDALAQIHGAGASTVVFTDIRRGARAGESPDVEAIATLAGKTAERDVSLYVDTGVRDDADVQAIAGVAGVHGVLLGHRIFAPTLDLAGVYETVAG